jgi:hypothetical protein
MAFTAAGFVDLKDGMNASRDPLLLGDAQCARAINVSFRGGLAKTRPAFAPWAYDGLRPTEPYRGGGVWSLSSGDKFVGVFGSEVWVVELAGAGATPFAKLDTSDGQCFVTQADRYVVVQDGTSAPVALEETESGIALVHEESVSLPVGYFGIYAHLRLHMVPKLVPNTEISGKPYLVSGDVMEPLNPITVLGATEVEYLSEGGAHGLPLEMGAIGGLGVMRNSQTGSGLGAVVVLARGGLCAFDFSISRDLWKEQSISQVLFFGPGCISPWGVASINDDLFYRGIDGLRTLRYSSSALAGSSGSLSSTPSSLEVNDFMKNDGIALPHVSIAECDNRVFCTASHDMPSLFKGLVVLDTASSFYNGAERLFGGYDGLWTGPRGIAQVLSWRNDDGRQLLLATHDNDLYSLDDDAVLDPQSTPIESRIETKAYTFGDLVSTKQLQFCEVSLSDISVDTEVRLWYRPHGYPLWAALGETTVRVPAGSLPQRRSGLRFPVDLSRETCDPVSRRPLYVATAFQFAIQWTGRATIDSFRAVVDTRADQPPDVCPESEGAVLVAGDLSGTTLDDFSYTFRGSD